MRDEKITIAKAIAIMLMVICHAGLPHVGGAICDDVPHAAVLLRQWLLFQG